MVVVSAMGKETDRLLSVDNNLEEYKNSDDIASLISGEQISNDFFSILLNLNNIKGKSFQGWQVPIYTRKNYLNSTITDINTKKIISCIKKNEVPVISGFQGINEDDRITTLGRGIRYISSGFSS